VDRGRVDEGEVKARGDRLPAACSLALRSILTSNHALDLSFFSPAFSSLFFISTFFRSSLFVALEKER
jgi:hypothetical protein